MSLPIVTRLSVIKIVIAIVELVGSLAMVRSRLAHRSYPTPLIPHRR